MGLFSRKRDRDAPAAATPRAERALAQQALEQWIAARHGVEVFVEPRTTVTGTSMLLVAHDGEFTRRLVEDGAEARAFARSHTLPIYDATVVGYPQRMRDYSRRRTVQRQQDARRALDGDDR